ncbi:hypothetical protein KR044_001280, partial [Drosophila immigrans]
VGDPCPTEEYRSSCQPAEDCRTLTHFIQQRHLSADAIPNCGFTTRGEKICCPLDADGVKWRSSPEKTPTTSTTTTTTTTTTKPRPEWMDIFKTDRDYLLHARAITVPRSPDAVVFPGLTSRSDSGQCQAPLYEGDCLPVSKCVSLDLLLEQGRLRDEDVHTCRPGTVEEIICCPVSLPLQPRVDTETRIQLPPADLQQQQRQQQQLVAETRLGLGPSDALLQHNRHLAALAYPNARFDGHLHRCTALLLMPQLLLASAGCGRPSHAVFGVADLADVDEDEDQLADIARMAVYRQDLTLLTLQEPQQGRQVATICSHLEQTRWQTTGQLIASAWAKSNASDCSLYELPMRLLPSSACRRIDNSAGIQDLPSRHMCAEPLQPAALVASHSSNSSNTSCLPCPAAVGSVLHLQRPDGSRCVLGVATPTGSRESCADDVMYFTSLVDRQLVKFVEDLRL